MPTRSPGTEVRTAFGEGRATTRCPAAAGTMSCMAARGRTGSPAGPATTSTCSDGAAGADTIDNAGGSASDDVLEFGAGIEADQLWFSRSEDDLVVRIVGTEDSVTIEDWYDGTDNRLDFELGDGSELAAENVHALVDAMAAFTPPGAGETEFTPAQHTTLDPILASNWQTPA